MARLARTRLEHHASTLSPTSFIKLPTCDKKTVRLVWVQIPTSACGQPFKVHLSARYLLACSSRLLLSPCGTIVVGLRASGTKGKFKMQHWHQSNPASAGLIPLHAVQLSTWDGPLLVKPDICRLAWHPNRMPVCMPLAQMTGYISLMPRQIVASEAGQMPSWQGPRRTSRALS